MRANDHMLVVMLGMVCCFQAMAASLEEFEEDPWRIDDVGEIVRCVTSGTSVWGHQFGFLVHKASCDEPLVWITLSTSVGDPEDFKGKTAQIKLTIGETSSVVSLELLYLSRLVPSLVVMAFTNEPLTPELIAMLESSTSVDVELAGPPGLVKATNTPRETFLLEGFALARKKTLELCGDGREDDGSEDDGREGDGREDDGRKDDGSEDEQER